MIPRCTVRNKIVVVIVCVHSVVVCGDRKCGIPETAGSELVSRVSGPSASRSRVAEHELEQDDRCRFTKSRLTAKQYRYNVSMTH